MKIEIHIRESDAHGKFIGRRNAFVESCRVYKETGDGLRLDNMSTIAANYFALHAKKLTKAWREAKTTEEFLQIIDLKGENDNVR